MQRLCTCRTFERFNARWPSLARLTTRSVSSPYSPSRYELAALYSPKCFSSLVYLACALRAFFFG